MFAVRLFFPLKVFFGPSWQRIWRCSYGTLGFPQALVNSQKWAFSITSLLGWVLRARGQSWCILGLPETGSREGQRERGEEWEKKLCQNGLEETTVSKRTFTNVRELLPVKWDVTSQNLTLIHIKWLGIGNKDFSLLLKFCHATLSHRWLVLMVCSGWWLKRRGY